MKNDFPRRMRNALVPNVLGSPTMERNSDRVDKLELTREMLEFDKCITQAIGQSNPFQRLIGSYFRSSVTSMTSIITHFNSVIPNQMSDELRANLANLFSQLKVGNSTLTQNVCSIRGISIGSLTTFFNELFNRRAQEAIDNSNPAYFIPTKEDFENFLSLWEGKGFPNIEKIYQIFIQGLTGCDGFSGALGVSLTTVPMPGAPSLSLTYYNEIGRPIERSSSETFRSYMERLNNQSIFGLIQNGLNLSPIFEMIQGSQLGPMPTEVLNRLSNNLGQCFVSDMAQTFSDFFGTQQELNVAMQEVGDRLKQAKESLLHSLGLHEVNRNWESDSQNPHTLESAIEASKENVLRGCNEAIRRKRQASHTVTDKELINYLMRSLQAHQQNLLNLKNAISELYEAAYEKYQSAQSEVEGAWVYVSENEANDLRWSKSEAEFLEHKNNMAREYMREINECLQRAQSEPLESDERPQT